MRTDKNTPLKKLIPLLLLALTLLFIIVIFYLFFQENSIEKIEKNENFSQTTENFKPEKNNQEKDLTFQATETKKAAEKKLSVKLPKKLEIPSCPETNFDAEDHEIVNHEAYSLCYRESFEQAEYSAYMLDSSQLVKNSSRTDNFRADSAVSTKSASPADYKSTGYDRGHLSPAADFAFSKEAMSESFFMSNMSPQAPGLNRGIWKDLENSVRDWAKSYGRIYVASGPILEKPAEDYKQIGVTSIVAVPEYYYKVVLIPLYKDDEDRATPEDADEVIALAFVFPNEKCSGTIWDYQVTVDEVEKRTGLDFFTRLEKSVESKIESEKTKLE